MGKTKNIINFDEEKLRVAVKAANTYISAFFGGAKEVSFDEEEVFTSILKGEPIARSEEWDYLLERVNGTTKNMRQSVIIRIAGDVHDYEVSQREKADAPISVAEYAWCMPWYLLGVNQILMIVKEPEVEAVLNATHLRKPPYLCFAFGATQGGDAIYRDGFSEVFMEYSENCRNKCGASDEELLDRLQEGKAFYPHLPMVVSVDLESLAPVVPLMIVRDIKNQRAIV